MQGAGTGRISEKHEIATITLRPQGESYFALECIAGLGGRNSPRGTIYNLQGVLMNVRSCHGRRPRAVRKRAVAKSPEDGTRLSLCSSSPSSSFLANKKGTRVDAMGGERTTCVFRDFRRLEDIIALHVSVKTSRVRVYDAVVPKSASGCPVPFGNFGLTSSFLFLSFFADCSVAARYDILYLWSTLRLGNRLNLRFFYFALQYFF